MQYKYKAIFCGPGKKPKALRLTSADTLNDLAGYTREFAVEIWKMERQKTVKKNRMVRVALLTTLAKQPKQPTADA